MKYIALIAAAGSGSRMGKTEKPKQFLKVNGHRLLHYTIDAFNKHPQIDLIVVVTNPEYTNEVLNIVEKNHFDKVKYIVQGGKTRQESVFNGLKILKENDTADDDVVLIHDAARPLVSQEIISKNIEASKKYAAVETAIKVTDTIVQSLNEDIVNNVPDRQTLYQAQTPQTFWFGLIYQAHEMAKDDPIATDDAQLIHKYLNRNVHIVEGEKKNFKVTTMEDYEYMKKLFVVIPENNE